MANITSQILAADIIDRMDNSVLNGEVADPLRQKLVAPTRLLQAINLAYIIFVSKSDPAALHQLAASVLLPADEQSSPTVNGLKTYEWPITAFQERVDGGILNVTLDGVEFSLNEATPLSSVRMQCSSILYGTAQPIYAYDLKQKRIYAPKDVIIKTRVISTPAKITALDAMPAEPTPGDLAARTLYIDEAYLATVSLLAHKELLKGTENPNNLGIIAQDTPVTTTGQQA